MAYLECSHCTNMEQAKDIYVRLGSIYRDKGGIIIPVKEIRRHPQYESVYHDFDIAILVVWHEHDDTLYNFFFKITYPVMNHDDFI